MNPNLKGVQLWKLRKRHGRDKLYKTPGELWSACVKYFEWVDANPVMERIGENEGNRFKDKRVVPHMRAMTIDGLSIFLGMTPHAWMIYRKREEFSHVCSVVETIIREQKFTGAAAGVLSASLISQDLGMKNKIEISGVDDGPVKIKWVKSKDDNES